MGRWFWKEMYVDENECLFYVFVVCLVNHYVPRYNSVILCLELPDAEMPLTTTNFSVYNLLT